MKNSLPAGNQEDKKVRDSYVKAISNILREQFPKDNKGIEHPLSKLAKGVEEYLSPIDKIKLARVNREFASAAREKETIKELKNIIKKIDPKLDIFNHTHLLEYNKNNMKKALDFLSFLPCVDSLNLFRHQTTLELVEKGFDLDILMNFTNEQICSLSEASLKGCDKMKDVLLQLGKDISLNGENYWQNEMRMRRNELKIIGNCLINGADIKSQEI